MAGNRGVPEPLDGHRVVGCPNRFVGRGTFFIGIHREALIMIYTLSQGRALFHYIKPMEPFPTIRLTRQEVERAALSLGAKFRTVQQWRFRGVPARWQLELIKHFGAAILIDDFASQALPPVRQRTLADLCREKFLTPSGIS
jgi:hypothetical protein